MDMLEQKNNHEENHCSYYYMPNVEVDWVNSRVAITDKVYDHELHKVHNRITDIQIETIQGLNTHMIVGLISLCSFGIINGPALQNIIEEWSIQYSLGSSTPDNISSFINQLVKFEIESGDFNVAEKINDFLQLGIVTPQVLKFIGAMYVGFPSGGLMDIIDSSVNLSVSNKLTPDITWKFLSGLGEVLDSTRMAILANGEALARNRASREDLSSLAATRVINKVMHMITNLSLNIERIWQQLNANVEVSHNFLKSAIEEEIESGIKSAAIFETYKIPKADRVRALLVENESQRRSISSMSKPSSHTYSADAGDILTSIIVHTRISKRRIVFRSSSECPAFANVFVRE